MENIKRAKDRLRSYPMLIGRCSAAAGKYAACVTRDLNVNHNVCEIEFNVFKRCLTEAATKRK